MKFDGLLLRLGGKLGHFPEPSVVNPRAETLPKAHLNNKRKIQPVNAQFYS
jgi:hypothetical protein